MTAPESADAAGPDSRETASSRMRIERDGLGSRDVPADALWGISTLRARENFPMTGKSVGANRPLIWALGAIKLAAARTNGRLGLITPRQTTAIATAASEVMSGRHDDQFIVDQIQGGAGTSTNMNANEVIAHRALDLLGHDRGDHDAVHPVDHVNRCQSTNDVYPTAARLALARRLQEACTEHQRLADAFAERAAAFGGTYKVGRTQLQDAVPMTLSQEFHAFAATLREDHDRLQELLPHLWEVNLGATAIGTGITAPVEYRSAVLGQLAELTDLPLTPAPDLIEATGDAGVFALVSGTLKRAAVKLSKICNDLRLLSSGPQTGLAEIRLPVVQAGSSIMPGKVNPVIPEVVNQVAFRVVGADAAVTMAVEGGQLQLNAFEPVIVAELSEATELLTTACRQLRTRCVTGIEPDRDVLSARMRISTSIATALSPHLGYETAASIAQESLRRGCSPVELVLETGALTREQLDSIVELDRLTGGG